MLDIKDNVCKTDELHGRVDGVRARAAVVGARGSGLGNVAFMILGWIEMCPRPVGSAFQRRTLRRYQAR
eukprot:COSAG04_NODE_1632_length_6108_cov_12.275087_3_plen_69_part_00